MEKYRGKVAIVTGASAGCGVAIVEQLVAAGMKVVGLARRQERVEELAKKLKGQPGKLFARKCDMTKEQDILDAFVWTKENLGPVYVLINNAGISRPTTLADGDTKMWKEVLETNIVGVAIATREAIRDMNANKVAGHIIHINSVLGHYVAHVPNVNMYTPSKFALTAMVETLRQELVAVGSKIRISSVSPGPIDTEFAQASKGDGQGDSEFDKFFKALPKLLAEDVADAVTYVLSTPPHVQVQDVMLRPLGEQV